MTKGLRRALLAPFLGAVLVLGTPAATLAAPSQPGEPPGAGQEDRRGARSAQPGEEDKKEQPGDKNAKPGDPGKDPKAGDAGKDAKPGDPGKDPKAGDAGKDKAPPPKDGDAGKDSNAGKEPNKEPNKDPKAPGKKGDAKDGKDGDDDYGSRYDRDDGHYDHHRYGHRGRYGWDTHRRYYRYGYRGPGWYDDCGYYGPDGYDGYYDSPDACSWQYGSQGESLRTNMSGDQIVPGPGAPNAFGTANLFVDLRNGLLCYRMGYDGISRALEAHIHAGGPRQSGRPVINLHPEANGDEGCVGADPTALRNVRDHPEAFYLQLHTAEYPDGAIRGQLFPTGSYG
ncbi:MAG: CHRD domain-containing protein [Acidimicrobiia bacterium]